MDWRKITEPGIKPGIVWSTGNDVTFITLVDGEASKDLQNAAVPWNRENGRARNRTWNRMVKR